MQALLGHVQGKQISRDKVDQWGPELGRGGKRLNGYRVSLGSDDNVLELDSDGNCTKLYT